MATSPDAVRGQLAAVASTAAAEVASQAATASPEARVGVALALLPRIVPAYYDAAGSLAALWYEELREEAAPRSLYVPTIIGDPATDWIEREVRKLQADIEADFEAELERLMAETIALAEKEVSRGFRDTITGNVHTDRDAIGWSRIARPGACKLCLMAADKGAVYTETTARFAAHTDCHCAARPEFAGGNHGPEASVEQYLAATKRRTDKDRARLREYLNTNYPDAPG